MNITVYLSSKSDLSDNFTNAVSAIGKGIGEMNARLIYGGSNAGQMHILAATAKQHGATVTGVIPEVFRQLSDPVVDEMIYTLDLSERKARMIELGQIFVALPGGIGTIDEVMSTLASLTVSRNFSKRILLVNVDGVFDQLIAMLPDIGLVCACVFATIAVYIALRSFAEIVQNSMVNRSMNEFMMRKLERLEENR